MTGLLANFAAPAASAKQSFAHFYRPPGSGAPLSACNKPVDKKQDNGPNYCSQEAGTLSGLVPADCLAEVGGDERADNSENGRENETGGLIVAGHNELRYYTGKESNDDGPNNAHPKSLHQANATIERTCAR